METLFHCLTPVTKMRITVYIYIYIYYQSDVALEVHVLTTNEGGARRQRTVSPRWRATGGLKGPKGVEQMRWPRMRRKHTLQILTCKIHE